MPRAPNVGEAPRLGPDLKTRRIRSVPASTRCVQLPSQRWVPQDQAEDVHTQFGALRFHSPGERTEVPRQPVPVQAQTRMAQTARPPLFVISRQPLRQLS
jgi:hypothetical protein